MKKMKKRLMAVALAATLMVASFTVVPVKSVYAEPPQDASVVMFDQSSYDDKNYNYTVIYEEDKLPQGVTFDKATKTVTLDNAKYDNLTLNCGVYSGTFNINIKGDNSIGYIEFSTDQDPRGSKDCTLNITGDGSLTVNKNKLNVVGIMAWEWEHTTIHVDKYVNLTVYGGESSKFNTPHFKGTGSVVNLCTTATKEESFTVDGDVEGGFKYGDSEIRNYGIQPMLCYVEPESGYLCKKKDANYDAYYIAKYWNSGTETKYYMCPINITETIITSEDYADATFSSLEAAKEDYEVYSSIPSQFAGRKDFSVSDGKVLAQVYERDKWQTFEGECTKDGKKYAFNADYTTDDKNGDNIITDDECDFFYYLFPLEVTANVIYDKNYGDYEAYYHLNDVTYSDILSNPFKVDDVGEKDNNFWSDGAYYEDLEKAGYKVSIKNTFYTHVVSNNPLVVKAKAKPIPTLTTAADTFTKTVGDAAFSLGAKSDVATITYKSSNPSVATVAADGTVTVVGEGTADITIEASGDGYQTATKVVKLTVNPVPTTEAPKVETTEAPKEETTEAPVKGTKETVGNATVTVTETKDGKTAVEYNGTTDKKATKVEIPSTVSVGGVIATVTSISENAFKGNTSVKQVTIPKTIEEIGDSAFKGCTNLQKVNIPNSVDEIGDSAFNGCKNLKTATISNGVEKIGANAFGGCTKLTKVTVPKSVKSIGKNAFKGCTSLTNADVKSTAVKTISQGAFQNCPKLKKVTVTNNVTKIDKNAFSGDKNLKNINIASTKLKTVGKNAFKNVPKTATATVPKAKKTAYTKLLRKGGFKGKIKAK